MELMRASNEWANRPSDERYTSLITMRDEMLANKRASRQVRATNRQLEVVSPDGKDLLAVGPSGTGYRPSHWAFGQLCGLTKAPSHYLRALPAPLAADCLTYGLRFEREAKDVGVLIQRSEDGVGILRAATGPNYGRIWNADITSALVDRFGDGTSGEWKVPGEFGIALREVTKDNTTLFASDRDMFVFLADEENRIEIPNRRLGRTGSLARGFFMWNSEVGSRSWGIASFLFDYVCCNRIVWGATEYKEIRLRHTELAPERALGQMMPALREMHEASTRPIVAAIAQAREAKISELDAWLQKRNVPVELVRQMSAVHMEEEERPIETVWDAVTAATAVARGYANQDTRVALETMAGKWMDGALGHVPRAATIEYSAEDLGV